jgi:hypothetical protein
MVSIRNIDPSCTCTLVNPDRTEVPPGEEGSFGVQVDLAKLSRGAKRFQVVVSYDLNGARRKALEIALVNDPDIQFIPDRLTLSGVIGEKLTGQITIVDYRHHLMSVKAIHSDFDSVTFTALETPKAYSEGWRHVFEVSVDTSKMPSGRYFPVINAVCDPPLSQPLKGSLDLNVLPRISLRPSSVVLDSGSAEGGQVVKFIELRDQLGDSKTIELQEIVCPHPRIKCDFIRAVEGHGPKLRLAWNTSEGVGSTRAVRISIRVRKPCQQEVTAYLSLR